MKQYQSWDDYDLYNIGDTHVVDWSFDYSDKGIIHDEVIDGIRGFFNISLFGYLKDVEEATEFTMEMAS